MNGETLEVYLRSSLNKIYDGRQPFAAQLKIQVEAIQLGIVLSKFFASVDTSKDKETILKETLGKHYRKNKMKSKASKKNIPLEDLINENDSPDIVNLIEVLYRFAMDSAPMNFMMLPKRFNNCLVGHTYQGNPVYNYNSMISVYCKEDKMTVEEAVEYMDFNVLCAHYGKDTIQPIFLFV